MPSLSDDLRARTKRFAFNIIDLVRSLPPSPAADPLTRQLIRAATSVASNHRAACRARSRREFVARLGIVLEEADESELWLEALMVCGLASTDLVAPLFREAGELRAIFSQSVRTARQRDPKP